MAWTLVQKSAAENRSTTGTTTPTLPVGSTAGNLLIACVTGIVPGTPFTGPAGWSSIAAITGTTNRTEIWWLPANPGGITSAAFTSGTSTTLGNLAEFHTDVPGAVLSTESSGTGTSTSTTVTATATAVNRGTDLAIFAGGWKAATATTLTFTDPSGFTLIDSDATTSAATHAYGGYNLAQAAGTAAGTLTASVAGTTSFIGAIVTITASVYQARGRGGPGARPLPLRARLGAAGLCAAGILATAQAAPPPPGVAVPPSRPGPAIQHPAAHRATWRTIRGTAYVAVPAPRQRPPGPRGAPPHPATWRARATAAVLPWLPSRFPPRQPSRPVARGTWRRVTGTPPPAAAQATAPSRPVPPPVRKPPHGAQWRPTLTTTVNAPPPSLRNATSSPAVNALSGSVSAVNAAATSTPAAGAASGSVAVLAASTSAPAVTAAATSTPAVSDG